MADIYIGEFGKKGDFFNIQTNFEDHKTTFYFDGCRFLALPDGLLVALHVTSIEGMNKKSTITFPSLVLMKLSTIPYEYESFTDGKKVKAMVEPTAREKLLLSYLTGDDDELNWEKNQGKGGFISIGSSANDVPILNGEGNAKKHARFVIEFDDDIKKFDMSGDAFALENLASKGGGKGGYSSKPAETEAQKIDTRNKALGALMLDMGLDLKGASESQLFIVHASLLLGLPVPNNITYTF